MKGYTSDVKVYAPGSHIVAVKESPPLSTSLLATRMPLSECSTVICCLELCGSSLKCSVHGSSALMLGGLK
jgi:hypothetical protein